MINNFIYPAWDAPRTITALTSTRIDGVSEPPFHQYNLAHHTGDRFEHVEDNRRHLSQTLNLPSSPCWLNQTHSNQVVLVDEDDNREADAAITRKPGQVLAIMTADCMPLLVCNRQGNEVAAIHAGWRGLANGIIENTILQMHTRPQDLLVWMGPAICEACFEVGDDVKSIFINQYGFVKDAFVPTQVNRLLAEPASGKQEQGDGERRTAVYTQVHEDSSTASTQLLSSEVGLCKESNKWLGNMVFIAKKICHQLGIQMIFESGHCTMEESRLFYSYRREGVTGRMASLIWFNR